MRKTHCVKYRKPGEESWAFTKPMTKADAERAARRYRRLGWEVDLICLPS